MMTNRLTTRWFVAAALLLFGLMVSGLTSPANNPEHLPARAQARAVSAQQSLQRHVSSTAVKAEQASAAPLLAFLLVLVVAQLRTRLPAVDILETPRESSLWLMPYLFRPPPINLVR
jgi:hypothetical protein